MITKPSDIDNPWRLFQAGKGEEAVSLLRERYMRNPTPGSSFSLGAALMWTEQYVAAHKHFHASLEKAKQLRMDSEKDYAFLGAAEWCVENYVSAIEHWQAGRTAPYAVLGVCIQTPMLLFIASTLRPELALNSDSIIGELREKLTDPRTGMWPGTLAQFVAGLTSIEAVQSSWIGTREQKEKGIYLDSRWKTDFYRELLSLHKGHSTVQRFKEAIARLTAPDSFTDWDEDAFVHLLRFPEFYIARIENRA